MPRATAPSHPTAEALIEAGLKLAEARGLAAMTVDAIVAAIGYRAASREQIEQGSEVTLVVRPEHMTSSDFAAETPIADRIWLLFKRFLPPWL